MNFICLSPPITQQYENSIKEGKNENCPNQISTLRKKKDEWRQKGSENIPIALHDVMEDGYKYMFKEMV